MADIWPYDVKRALSSSGKDAIRPFRCLLLMPFENRFEQVAEIIRQTVEDTATLYSTQFNLGLPRIDRLDWVTSTGVIQQELWQKVDEADLVFGDITGYNPNVMFELGVCAAWKQMKQVVLVKDHFFQQQSAFDIAPIRYTEYQLTTEGVEQFKAVIRQHTINALIAFPDLQGDSPSLTFPIHISFQDNRDDLRIYTPPYAHRRVIAGALEFGSRSHFPHSWASIGKEQFLNFTLEFSARFSNPIPNAGYIGVGLRSQHFYANFAHILYLNHEGQITVTEPTEEPPNFYQDKILRGPSQIDLRAYHLFKIVLNESVLDVEVDDFHRAIPVTEMRKVLGAGLIRFQSHMSWMVIREVMVRT